MKKYQNCPLEWSKKENDKNTCITSRRYTCQEGNISGYENQREERLHKNTVGRWKIIQKVTKTNHTVQSETEKEHFT